MSSIENDQCNLVALNEAYGESQLGLDILNAKIDRLLEYAFENKNKAWRSINGITRGYGVEATIALLEDQGWLPRSHYFGFMRGHLFAKGARTAARLALQELPAALREREMLLMRRDDLLRARRHISERLDHERLAVDHPDLSRALKAGRPRS